MYELQQSLGSRSLPIGSAMETATAMMAHRLPNTTTSDFADGQDTIPESWVCALLSFR